MSFSERLGRKKREVEEASAAWESQKRNSTEKNKKRIESSEQYKKVLEILESDEFEETMKKIWETYASETRLLGLFFDRTVSKPKFKVDRLDEWLGLGSELVIWLRIQLRHKDDNSFRAKSTHLQVSVQLDVLNDVVTAKWGLPICDVSDPFEISAYAKMNVKFFDSFADLQSYLIEHLGYGYSLRPRGEFANI